MEKMPSLKIIGNIHDENKREVEEKFKNKLFNHINSLPKRAQEEIKKLEYKKTKEQLKFIDMANKETNELMRYCGVESFDIPIDNFHILPPDLYKVAGGIPNTIGTASYENQAILFDALKVGDNDFVFANSAFHESLHLKSVLIIQVEEQKNGLRERQYRSGVDVLNTIKNNNKTGENILYFNGLHEAIVSVEEKKFNKKLLDLPDFKNEKKSLEENKEEILKISENKKIPIEDFSFFKKGEDDQDSRWGVLGYRKQREVYDYICREILKNGEGKYRDLGDVQKEFLKAHFTGKILSIARIVEDTFGENSFRILGGMGVDDESTIKTRKILENMRRQVLKKRGE